jgi:hypothetical protein
LETRAISRVFGQDRDISDPVRIGSVKTNVGHLEAASGVAGVVRSEFFPSHYVDNREVLGLRKGAKIRFSLDQKHPHARE